MSLGLSPCLLAGFSCQTVGKEAAPLPRALLNHRGSAGLAAPCLQLLPRAAEFLSWAFPSARSPQPPPPHVHVTPPGIARGQHHFPQRVPGFRDWGSSPSFLLLPELLLTLSLAVSLQAWLTEIHEYAQQDVVLMLLGNKVSLAPRLHQSLLFLH